MIRQRLAAAVLALVAATLAQADVLVVDHEAFLDSRLIRIASGTDAITDLGTATFFPTTADLQPAHDGHIYFATSAGFSAFVRARPDMTDVSRVASIWDTSDIALDAAGALVVLDRWSGPQPETGVYEVQTDGTTRLLDSIPGFSMMGMDIPHAGPYRDGLLVIGFTDAPLFEYFLYRYRRLPDGRLDREGPFGPLEAAPFVDCAVQRGFVQLHVATRADGLSFLSIEGCSDRVLEHDIDGRFLGALAVVGDDSTLPDPFNPALVYDDHLTAVHVTPTDEVYVATRKRVRHFDAEGNLVNMLPLVFRVASALGDAEPAPFERDDASCRASGVGYWKRQCLSRDIGFARRPTRSNPRFGQGPGLHPTFQDGRLGGLIDRVTRDLEPHGVSACEALWPSDPSSWRGKALTRLAALYFDIEDGRLGLDCVATVDGADVTVRAALRQIAGFLAEDTTDSFKAAFHVAESIMGGVR